MQLGNAAWGLRETPLEQQLALTAEMELGLLELSIAGYDRDFLQLDATPGEIRTVRELFARYGVSPECACTGNDFTNADAKEQAARVRRVIDIAAEAGARKLRIFAGFNSDSVVYGERFDTMLNMLADVAAHARTRGVTLAVETHGGVTANGGAFVHFASVTTRIDLWPEILKTGVGINFDPANFAAVGATDPTAFFKRFRNDICYMHLKDFRSVPGGVLPAACGEGRLDWTELLDALAGYNGPALLEYEVTGDVEDGLRRSLAFLKKRGIRCDPVSPPAAPQLPPAQIAPDRKVAP